MIKKADIIFKKANINLDIYDFTQKTKENIKKLYLSFFDCYFGRTDIMNVLDIKKTRASDLIKDLLENRIIIPVRGYGKGKYKFSLSIGI